MKRALSGGAQAATAGDLQPNTRPLKIPKHNPKVIPSPVPIQLTFKMAIETKSEHAFDLSSILGLLVSLVDSDVIDGLCLVDDCLILLQRRCLKLVYATYQFLSTLDLKKLNETQSKTLIQITKSLILECDLDHDAYLPIITTMLQMDPQVDHNLIQCLFKVMETSPYGFDWAEEILLKDCNVEACSHEMRSRGHIVIESFFKDKGANPHSLIQLWDAYPFFWRRCLKSSRFHELLTRDIQYRHFNVMNDPNSDLILRVWKDPTLEAIADAFPSPFIYLTLLLKYNTMPHGNPDKARAVNSHVVSCFQDMMLNPVNPLTNEDYFNLFRICSTMATEVHGGISFPCSYGAPSDMALLYPFIQSFGDVELQAGGGRGFKCHKVVLAQASRYFECLFTINMKERSEAVIRMHDLEDHVLESLIYYAYHHTIQFNSMEQVVDMLFAASRFQMDTLKEDCYKAVIQHLTFDTFADVYNVIGEVSEFAPLKSAMERWLIHTWNDMAHDHPLRDNDIHFWKDITQHYLTSLRPVHATPQP